jgi:hypothetical protein
VKSGYWLGHVYLVAYLHVEKLFFRLTDFHEILYGEFLVNLSRILCFAISGIFVELLLLFGL